MTEIDLAKEWPCYGVPDYIAVDNGLDLVSFAVSMACLQLGIEVMRMPPREPWYKGTIERFGRTMNTRLVHWLPGTTYGGQKKGYDYNPEASACITFDDFCRAFEHYVVKIHNRTPRRNKPGVPIELFTSHTKTWPVRLPEDIEDFNAVFALTIRPTLQQAGFQYEHERYNSMELGDLWNHMPENSKVIAKVDPTDIRQIRVIDPRTNKPIVVPCLNHYDAPRPLALHKMIFKFMKENGLNPDLAEHRVQAQHDLAAMVNEASANGRKLRKLYAQQSLSLIDSATQERLAPRNQMNQKLDQGVADLEARMAAALKISDTEEPLS